MDPGDPVLIEKPVYAYAGTLHVILVIFSKGPEPQWCDSHVRGVALRDDRQVFSSILCPASADSEAGLVLQRSRPMPKGSTRCLFAKLSRTGLLPSPNLKSCIPFRCVFFFICISIHSTTVYNSMDAIRRERPRPSRDARRCWNSQGSTIFSSSKVGPHRIYPSLTPSSPNSCHSIRLHHTTQDDPYYFMYFGTRPRIASYFMLEAQTSDRSVGRILRFDSFSKILSSGIRIGFVTGPAPLLDAIDRHVSHAQTNPSFHFSDGAYMCTGRRLSQTSSHLPFLKP